MREEILKQFFLGHTGGPQLQEDLRDSVRQLDPVGSEILIEDMEDSFQVNRAHLITLCDAIANGYLQPDALMPIGFALQASDNFEWDDELMSEVIADWSCPEINYSLNTSTVEQFKRWLTGEESYPTKPTLGSRPQQNRLISMRRKSGG
ncbi:MAG: hypothetical protein WA634_06600 [Silvibacterium sp.]